MASNEVMGENWVRKFGDLLDNTLMPRPTDVLT